MQIEKLKRQIRELYPISYQNMFSHLNRTGEPCIVYGAPGSGTAFLYKLQCLQAIATCEDTYILDPDGDMLSITAELGGTIVNNIENEDFILNFGTESKIHTIDLHSFANYEQKSIAWSGINKLWAMLTKRADNKRIWFCLSRLSCVYPEHASEWLNMLREAEEHNIVVLSKEYIMDDTSDYEALLHATRNIVCLAVPYDGRELLKKAYHVPVNYLDLLKYASSGTGFVFFDNNYQLIDVSGIHQKSEIYQLLTHR